MFAIMFLVFIIGFELGLIVAGLFAGKMLKRDLEKLERLCNAEDSLANQKSNPCKYPKISLN